MKVLFQSDDFGITEGVTLGIIKGIEEGIIRNSGLFVNMPSSAYAANFIKSYPNICFGLDLNIATGKPISDPEKISSLLNVKGNFKRSTELFKDNKIIKHLDTVVVEFEEEPYKYEHVYEEFNNQYNKYIELVGKKPEYLHVHSLVTPITLRAIRKLSDKYKIPFTLDILKEKNIYSIPSEWNLKPVFNLDDQKETNVTSNVLNALENNKEHQYAYLIFHAGYVDATLLDVSSYTIIRTKDLQMATSIAIRDYLTENNIELITYRDLK